jgi:hypothetical protein
MLIIVVILTTLVAPFLLKLTATKQVPIEESV